MAETYPRVWVSGEVQRLKASPRGHLYFEVVEKGDGDTILGKLDAVIWRSDVNRIRRTLSREGQELGEGQEIRCRGRVDFYPPSGRLQLVVREVDPSFTLGQLERRRRETLEALVAAGLIERNRGVPLSRIPLNIGLVTSHHSAAYADFLSTLRESGYGFRVLFQHASVQGGVAESELVSAITQAAELPLDCLIVIRGGGSRSDLAVFDSRRLAEVIARAPIPVLTGLGHEIDQAIADLVAHTALKTPTKVAEFLVSRVQQSERDLVQLHVALPRAARHALAAARGSLRRSEHVVRDARLCLRSEAQRLRALGRLLVALAQTQVRSIGSLLEAKARLCAELAPARTLRRGYSITRDAEGRLVRQTTDVAAGELVHTQLANGVIVAKLQES